MAIKVTIPEGTRKPIIPVPARSKSNVNPNLKNLTTIATAIRKSKRCVVVTGAGISVSGGIPDFRSADGLYNLVKSKYPNVVVKGKDMFDAHLFKDPATTQVFYTFMGELKDLISNAQVTATHHFIKHLHESNRLLRCYTQNIDGLEARLGMPSDLEYSKSRPSNRESNTPTSKRSCNITGARVVRLHGDLDSLICTLCKSKYAFSDQDVLKFKAGQAPACPKCIENDERRRAQGRRTISVGTLRPNIVLYNEHHNQGDVIADLTAQDLRKKPDLLIVMGTSLKVHGIKHLVKDIAKAVHAVPNRLVILVNRVELGKAEWDDIFDYHIEAHTDDAVRLIECLMEHMDGEAKRKESVKEASRANQPETGVCIPLSPTTRSKLLLGRSGSPAYDQENTAARVSATPSPIPVKSPISSARGLSILRRKPAGGPGVASAGLIGSRKTKPRAAGTIPQSTNEIISPPVIMNVISDKRASSNETSTARKPPDANRPVVRSFSRRISITSQHVSVATEHHSNIKEQEPESPPTSPMCIPSSPLKSPIMNRNCLVKQVDVTSSSDAATVLTCGDWLAVESGHLSDDTSDGGNYITVEDSPIKRNKNKSTLSPTKKQKVRKPMFTDFQDGSQEEKAAALDALRS
ncbi:hypothetical protein SeMB42_g07582 [Synchytrium endobioticum]|uniref:Deacetylase sirtuin-type domain-containing protein n=1 Tax=Synchytrium endobioticum TaxID=286115 RepID=A0A507DCJ4_9FUNG|nr:hypothetical protein SeMB42_g07582 [Synchytrium endobioticum]TPX49077.1 hypothetical protein SeLEV6574_g01677 [Synchytrium endobioticum]